MVTAALVAAAGPWLVMTTVKVIGEFTAASSVDAWTVTSRSAR
jgi:hypothetical protein